MQTQQPHCHPHRVLGRIVLKRGDPRAHVPLPWIQTRKTRSSRSQRGGGGGEGGQSLVLEALVALIVRLQATRAQVRQHEATELDAQEAVEVQKPVADATVGRAARVLLQQPPRKRRPATQVRRRRGCQVRGGQERIPLGGSGALTGLARRPFRALIQVKHQYLLMLLVLLVLGYPVMAVIRKYDEAVRARGWAGNGAARTRQWSRRVPSAWLER